MRTKFAPRTPRRYQVLPSYSRGMPKLVLGLSLAVAFLLGCVITQATAPTPSPAFAGPPGTVQHWEYYCFNERSVEDVMHEANEAGTKGWELVAAAGAGAQFLNDKFWCFKRPR